MGEPQEVIADRILEALLPGGRASSNSTVNVHHHEGKGTSVAVTACLVMLTAMLVGAFWVSREFTRIDSYVSDLKNTNDIQDAYINKLRAEQKKEKP